MCFFAGGMRLAEQGFLLTPSQLNSTLLTLSVIAVLLPSAFHFAVGTRPDRKEPLSHFDEGWDILKMSHGVALLLLSIYASYLYFQLGSHAYLYDQEAGAIRSVRYPKKGAVGNSSAAAAAKEDEKEDRKPKMSKTLALGLLIVVTVLVAFTAEFLVDSIDGLTDTGNISKEWVSLILLPIVGNAAEHATAVTVSVKDKLDLSIGVAVGSSIQISLFVIPLITVLGWIMGRNLTLLFDPFETIVLFLSVMTVTYVVQDGKSNWLEGMVLMILYGIIGTIAWFYPGNDVAGTLYGGVCRTSQLHR
jgi:Ca2+:H+ antiporter